MEAGRAAAVEGTGEADAHPVQTRDERPRREPPCDGCGSGGV